MAETPRPVGVDEALAAAPPWLRRWLDRLAAGERAGSDAPPPAAVAPVRRPRRPARRGVRT